MTRRQFRVVADDGQRRTPRLRDLHPAVDGPELAAAAVDIAVHLAAAIRDEGPHNVAWDTDHLTRQELVALVVALAAMVPADVDPVHALAWIEQPARDWPADVLSAEARRHDDGARDATAVLAVLESDRRLTAHLHRPAADVEGRAS